MCETSEIIDFLFQGVFYLSRIIGGLLVGVFPALFGCFLASATSPDGFETKPKNILIVIIKMNQLRTDISLEFSIFIIADGD